MTLHLKLLEIGFAFLAVVIFWRLLYRKRPMNPPGPKGYPIIGNFLDMPTKYEWTIFTNWGEQWGDICSVTVLGVLFVILNSTKEAYELLDKKGAIYSSRPVSQMAGELCGYKDSFVLLPYGDRLRRYRRMFHTVIGSPSHIKKFEPVQTAKAHKFLYQILENPESLEPRIRHLVGAIILRISHGYEAQDHDDPLVILAQTSMEQFSLATAPGGFLVDILPLLRYVPSWFPGANFQKLAKIWRVGALDMLNKPYEYVKCQMKTGQATLSFTSSLLEGRNLSAEEEEDVKWAAMSLYAGGADTTVAALSSFFLAMTLYPEVVKKAQAEIDAVVGNSRLPTFEDRGNLPYMDSVVKEVLRWHSVIPTGIHYSTQDDIHKGYFIPKGSLIIVNLWNLTHDPKVYQNPFVFNPDRYIGTDASPAEPDPRSVCFGYGRRICPGMHIAEASIFITCVMTLAVFDITKVVENGIVNVPVHDNITGTISHPKPFKCSIVPRSGKAASLIRADD